MKAKGFIDLMWILAVISLLGHDFIPHLHVHVHGPEKHHVHHHHEQSGEDDQDFDVVDLFNHTHGAGQQGTALFAYGKKSGGQLTAPCVALLTQSHVTYHIEGKNQVDFPDIGHSNPPPLLPGSKQLRAPPIASSALS